MRQLERAILLQIIDNRWREHLYEMDYLREGIHLRGFAQIDPLVAYKNEGFSMFEALMHSIWEEFARLIFHVEVEVAPRAQEQFAPQRPRQVDYSGGTAEQPSALGQAAVATAARRRTRPPSRRWRAPPAGQRRWRDPRAGDGRQGRQGEDRPQRPCWCGSGKKYKKCHGA